MTLHFTRRGLLTAGATTAAAFATPRAFAQVGPVSPTPFRMAVPQAKLDLIRQQVLLARTAAPVPEADPGSHGMTTAWLEALRQHWVSGYDWRAA